MAGLARAGVDVLVSLLDDAEVHELHLDDEHRLAEADGMTFRRLPTADQSVPDRAATMAMAAAVAADLAGGREVAVHCRTGIGRSSTLAAAVLVHEGLTPEDAWQLIGAARGLPVPDTEEQRAFVRSLADHRLGHRPG
jgi:protein-tyrosine phosphatase